MSSETGVKGMLTQLQLTELVKSGAIDTVILAFTDHYGRLMGKRFDAEYFINEASQEGGHACNYLLTVDMEMEPIQGYEYAGWQTGYGDFRLAPDWQTLRLASWLERTALLLCNVVDEKSNNLTDVAPRSILLQQIKQLAEAGFTAMASSELEYYIFQNSYQEAAQKEYHHLQPAGWYIEDYHILQGTREEPFNSQVRKHLKNSGVPVETSKGEWGLGQHEMNVRYSDVLTMADRHCVYKQCLKEVAEQMKLSVTFMAKQLESQAGSSCHLHISLWQQGRNAFCGEKNIGAVKASDYFRWFLAGWIHHVPDMMVFYAPTINSYKRYQSGSWAPTRLGWSYDNRTAGFRVVGHGSGLRIECRIPGADCNPYLAFAASLASGLDGINQQMEPPEIFQGDIYAAQNLAKVPATLHAAVSLFDASAFATRALGESVKKHYVHFYRTECELYDKAVTDWERKRYFERI